MNANGNPTVSDLQRFISNGKVVLGTITYKSGLGDDYPVVDNARYSSWRAQVLNYLNTTLSQTNHYYIGFKSSVRDGTSYPSNVNSGISLLESLIEDLDNNVFSEPLLPANITNAKAKTNEVFIVHGHDNLALTMVARFLEHLQIKPIILHEQSNSGRTIIEKIEEYTNVGFAVVLYTNCDVGGKDTEHLQPRARQNVVFEHGYLIGKIGRKNVCALVKGNIETPGDITGVVYTAMDENEGWPVKLARELRASGYQIDMNSI